MRSRCEAAVAHLAFPVVTGAAIAWAIYWIEAGGSPISAFVLAQVPAFGVVIALERLFPYQSEWSRSHRDVWVDARHMATITIFGSTPIIPTTSFSGMTAVFISASIGVRAGIS